MDEQLQDSPVEGTTVDEPTSTDSAELAEPTSENGGESESTPE